MVLWLVWAGCAPSADPALSAELEAQRADARATLPPAPLDFSPDVVLHVSPPLVARLVRAGLQEVPAVHDERVVMGVGLRTELHVDKVELRDGAGDHLVAATYLVGHIDVDAGYFGKSFVPVGIEALVGVRIGSEAAGDALRATAAPVAVESFTLELPALSPRLQPVLNSDLVREPLRKRVEAALLARAPVEIASWSRADAPIRGFRVEPEGLGLRVAMLSAAVHPGRVEPAAPAHAGFRLDAASDSALWLARAEAFAQPPIDLQGEAAERLPDELKEYAPHVQILTIPERLRVEDDTFVLDVRLWRMVDGGPAWWREYAAHGQLLVDKGNLRVQVGAVDPGPTSAQAGTVDPLAALAQAVVLSSFTEPLIRTLPATRATAARGHVVQAVVERVSGEGEIVHVHGSLVID